MSRVAKALASQSVCLFFSAVFLIAAFYSTAPEVLSDKPSGSALEKFLAEFETTSSKI